MWRHFKLMKVRRKCYINVQTHIWYKEALLNNFWKTTLYRNHEFQSSINLWESTSFKRWSCNELWQPTKHYHSRSPYKNSLSHTFLAVQLTENNHLCLNWLQSKEIAKRFTLQQHSKIYFRNIIFQNRHQSKTQSINKREKQ